MAKNEKIIIKEESIEKVKDRFCFVITPIGNETDPIRRHVDGIIDAAIIPALEEFGYKPRIPHRLSMPGSINKQIIQEINDCDLVLANLTEKNPNVMYELALRHCLGTPAIMIAEKGTELPFDINNQRTIFYVNDAQGVIALQAELKKAIKEITEKCEYKSPIISALGEIKMEKQLIEKEKENGDNSAVLGLILRRLDRIERDVRITNDEKLMEKSRAINNRIRKIMFSVTIPENEIGVDIDAIVHQLIEELPVEYNEFFVDGKTIKVKAYLKETQDLKMVYRVLNDFCEHNGLEFNILE